MRIYDELKKMVPVRLKRAIRRAMTPKEERDRDAQLGLFILDQAESFSRHIGGQPESLTAVLESIAHLESLTAVNEAHQYLQTALMPEFEKNLYEYYRQQEYLILLTFLSYPFRGPGSLTLEPFLRGAKKLGTLRILDYGAGLAFGIIHLLRTCPEAVESITTVDLDLIHSRLAAYIVSTMAPGKDCRHYMLRDAEEQPSFADRKFNCLFGDNVFEHLREPERVLRSMLQRAEETSICYFDLADHGRKYLQHVHPQLSHLEEIMTEFSFVRTEKVGGVMEYVRGLPPRKSTTSLTNSKPTWILG